MCACVRACVRTCVQESFCLVLFKRISCCRSAVYVRLTVDGADTRSHHYLKADGKPTSLWFLRQTPGCLATAVWLFDSTTAATAEANTRDTPT